nr:response regulator [Myxococcales bacterium]
MRSGLLLSTGFGCLGLSVACALLSVTVVPEWRPFLPHLIGAVLVWAVTLTGIWLGRRSWSLFLPILGGFGLVASVGAENGGLTGFAHGLGLVLVALAYMLLGVRGGVPVVLGLLGWAIAVSAQGAPLADLMGFSALVVAIAIVMHVTLAHVQEFQRRRELALESLSRVEAYQRSILNTMSDGLMVLGPDLRVVVANRAAAGMLGRSAESLFARHLHDLVERTMDPTGPWPASLERIEVRLRGTGRTALLSMAPHGSTTVEMVCVLTDISRLKAAEEVQRRAAEMATVADRTKSRFLANMSHELRTPLNAILGYSEMLCEDLDNEDLRTDVERIQVAGRLLLSLINDVLDLSKVEADRMEIVRERVDLDELVESVVDTIQPLAARNANRFVLDCPEVLGTAMTDGQRLRQVLMNLLSNACKFTEEGRITLSVRVSRWTARFEVIDTGIGISDEELSRLFEPFAQAHAQTSRKYGGTGLGLALCDRFASMLGGSLGVVSKAGQGSTFALEIPLSAHKPGVTPGPVPRRAEAPIVLCVDDDTAMLTLLERTLGSAGYHAITTANSSTGLELAREHAPSAIILDVHMPQLDGWTVLGALKDDPITSDIPVIVVSISDEERRGYVLGAADYLVKPVERARLLQAVSKVVP